MTKLPDLAASFQKMKLIDRLADECTENNLIGITLLHAIWSKEPPNLILQTAKDMITDNPASMHKLIGECLCNDILNLEI